MTDVQHQENQQRFVIHYEKDEAELTYRLFNNGDVAAIDFTRTYVPPQFRGKGFAETLVRTGLAWAKAQGYEIHASCWYVAKFLR